MKLTDQTVVHLMGMGCLGRCTLEGRSTNHKTHRQDRKGRREDQSTTGGKRTCSFGPLGDWKSGRLGQYAPICTHTHTQWTLVGKLYSFEPCPLSNFIGAEKKAQANSFSASHVISLSPCCPFRPLVATRQLRVPWRSLSPRLFHPSIHPSIPLPLPPPSAPSSPHSPHGTEGEL